MNLLVAGASGRTGRLLTRLALGRGHSVTALVRSASEPMTAHPRLRVVIGDVLEPSMLPSALAGQDAVVSLVAPRPRTSGRVYVEGTRSLADAAARAGVRRFVAVSAEGAAATKRTLPLGLRLVMRIPVVARLYPDIARMEDEIAVRDDLDWTIVAPPVLTNGPFTGAWRTSTEGSVPRGMWLSRADLAAFVLGVAEDGSYVRERVAVAR